MKVGFASGDWSQSIFDENGHPVWGGAGWARLGQYQHRLDMEVVVGSLVRKDATFGVRDWDGGHHFDCDVLVMQRIMIDDVADRIPAARANGQVIINDLDDWYWGLTPSNHAFWGSHPKVNASDNINHYRAILARSSGVTVSTPYLADRLRQFCRDVPVEVIPNHVDLDRFQPRLTSLLAPPSVGWVGSTAHRSGDLETMRGVLGPLVRDGYVRVHHSGAHPHAPSFAEAVGVPEEVITTLPLVAPADYPSLLVFDIGIVPLHDTPFNHGKSFIKGLELAAAGIPFVASAVGAYVDLRETYGVGRTAKNPKQWISHLKQLCDPDVRATEAALNRERLQPLSIDNGAKLFGDYLRSWV